MSISLMLTLCAGLGPAAVAVEPLPFNPDDWRRLPQVECRVTERDSPTVYTGVPLAVVLKDRTGGSGQMAALRSLSDAVILVRADDGYQAAVSAAEVAMDPEGKKYLLALSRDGKPLGEGQGPVKLIVPGDPQHVRWVRMVTSLHLVRLNSLRE